MFTLAILNRCKRLIFSKMTYQKRENFGYYWNFTLFSGRNISEVK